MISLVETVARAILAGHDWTDGAHIGESETTDEVTGWDALQPDWQEAYRKMARAALSAINASGEWWLVERKKIDGIANEFIDVPPQQDANPVGFHAGWEFCARAFHGALRTAYLAKS